jgi:hypothetical protein
MKFIIAIALLLVLAVVVMMLLRPSGPRITTIERDREIDEDGDRR